MKVSKLLLLGTLLVALCMALPAMAVTNSLVLTFSVTEDFSTCTGTLHYSLILTNQNIPGANPATVDITFNPPGPTGANLAFGPTVTLDPNVYLAVGATRTYNYDGAGGAIARPALAVDLGAIPLDCAATVAYALAGFDGVYNATPAYDAIDSRNIPVAILSPDIQITKLGDKTAFCQGADPNVTYTYYVENTGNEDLNDVTVVDSNCSSVTGPTGDNGDGLLNPGETWTYTCITQLTGTTLNIVDVNALGLYTGVLVSDSNEWLVEEESPPVVIVNPALADICETGSVQLCAEVTGGVGPFDYSWTKDGQPFAGDVNCIDVNEAGEYCVTVTDTATDCNDIACGTVTVIQAPDCLINSGPRSLCQEDVNTPVQYCSGAAADNYLWSIVSGPATIDGAADANCVTIIPTGLGTIVLGLEISNDVPGDGTCGDSCQIEILVEECGQTFCSFTQGFWGNANGKACGGTKSIDLIAGCVPITVGLPGHSITLGTAQCVIDLMPAGGTPAVLPAGDFTCATIPASILKEFSKKESRFNNVLIGQVVALTLNLCVAEGCVEDAGILADWVLPEDFCTVPYDDPNACAEYSIIPSSLAGKTVSELLAAANAALAGDTTYSLSDIYNAVTAINEGFDECRTVVPCIRPEICGNGCDDDGDGLIDCADGDCVAFPACID